MCVYMCIHPTIYIYADIFTRGCTREEYEPPAMIRTSAELDGEDSGTIIIAML